MKAQKSSPWELKWMGRLGASRIWLDLMEEWDLGKTEFQTKAQGTRERPRVFPGSKRRGKRDPCWETEQRNEGVGVPASRGVTGESAGRLIGGRHGV